ncbi:hypothetical protein Lrub_1753 [Legionella rubrilucens]|uniref:CAAX amino terminal protease self-immunity n=1 Tax=Legionella rubrilucens TaxID=458 RepID=A0A0W0XQT9_9GAMM|nr:CPBP family intramembrane metalloprotease [Legionella rubrilucens]KTD46831.1 hypothetical protein Lrub_1753 [Legionella rubrilucens]
MLINWPLIVILTGLSLPGIVIAIPRLIHLLLPQNTEELRKKISRFAMLQTLMMVILMSFAGTVLSLKTGLNEPILQGLLHNQPVMGLLQEMLLPVFLSVLVGLLVFFFLYYGVMVSILDDKTLTVLYTMRAALRLDGCILYGGVVEEIIGRFGLMNVIAYFGALFTGRISGGVIGFAMLSSGLLLSLGHLPAYIAAGCAGSRRFAYAMVLLNLWQTALFGWLFWQYGLLAAIAGHVLFHIGWYLYDPAPKPVYPDGSA